MDLAPSEALKQLIMQRRMEVGELFGDLKRQVLQARHQECKENAAGANSGAVSLDEVFCCAFPCRDLHIPAVYQPYQVHDLVTPTVLFQFV